MINPTKCASQSLKYFVLLLKASLTAQNKLFLSTFNLIFVIKSIETYIFNVFQDLTIVHVQLVCQDLPEVRQDLPEDHQDQDLPEDHARQDQHQLERVAIIMRRQVG